MPPQLRNIGQLIDLLLWTCALRYNTPTNTKFPMDNSKFVPACPKITMKLHQTIQKIKYVLSLAHPVFKSGG